MPPVPGVPVFPVFPSGGVVVVVSTSAFRLPGHLHTSLPLTRPPSLLDTITPFRSCPFLPAHPGIRRFAALLLPPYPVAPVLRDARTFHEMPVQVRDAAGHAGLARIAGRPVKGCVVLFGGATEKVCCRGTPYGVETAAHSVTA